MLLIQGPFPSNTTAVVLPSPRETNNESLRASIQTIRKMDGSLSTYVKPRDQRKKYRWEFVVGNSKAKEVEDYMIDNAGELAMVTWNGTIYIGYVTLNPFEMSGDTQEFYRLLVELEEA